MTTFLLFLLGFIMYSSQAYITYSVNNFSKFVYYALACISSCIGAVIWFTIARMHQHSTTYKLSIFWDLMIVSAYLFIPLILKRVTLTSTGILGILMILTGISLVHSK